MIRPQTIRPLLYLVLLLGVGCAEHLRAEKPGKQAEALVAQLGHDRFSVRERATAQLIALGAPARDALERGISSVDREVRYRSRTVLAIIQDLDFQDRLGKFARDPDLDNDYDLPGWQRFRKSVGDDRSAKPLFVGMYRAEPKLMRGADDSAARVGKALDRRCLELKQSVQLLGIRHSTSSVAALLFLAGHENLSLNGPTNSTLYFFCQQSDVYAAVRVGPSKRSYRQLLARWLSRPQNDLPRDAMMLGMQYEIHEVLPRARQTVRDPTARAYDRQFAILAIAKFGDQADMELLESLLGNELICTEFRRQNAQIAVQIRDTALAALLHLTKQDFTKAAYPSLKLGGPYVFNLATLGFATDEQREAALANWSSARDRATSAEGGQQQP